MLGLFMKDLYYLRGLKKNFMLIFLIFIALGLINSDVSFCIIFMLIITASYTLYPFTYDNYGRWEEYLFALPITKNEAVVSRYLFGLTIGGGGLILSIIIFFILYTLKGVDALKGMSLWNLLQFGFSCILILEGIIFPLIYQFGVEKGRIALFIVCTAIPLIILSIVKKLKFSRFPIPEPQTISFIINLIPIGAILFFILSFFISLYIVKKKK